jgi:dolichol-phosphate mannosyltransferase
MEAETRTLAVVIPAFRAEATVTAVIQQIPEWVAQIIVVDDASPDQTIAVASGLGDPRVVIVRHDRNRGVGGAMVSGFKKALDSGVDLVAKIDADNQMDPQYLDRFVAASVRNQCDYVKANRFGHIGSLAAMPKVRLVGNLILTFLTKFVSGYWNVFDPQNGYILITRELLKRLDLDRLDKGYFFENSMLIQLNIMRARIAEIYLPARYDNEVSSMKLPRILISFPGKLLRGYLYRIYHKYIFRSLSPFAFLAFFGLMAMTWGVLWGGVAWWFSYTTQVAATTGTVMIALLPFLLGWTALLQAFVLDVQDAGPCFLFDFDDEALRPVTSRQNGGRSSCQGQESRKGR